VEVSLYSFQVGGGTPVPIGFDGMVSSLYPAGEREFLIDNLLARMHIIIEMIWWTGLAP
jgi:hypothetical protein